MTLFCCINDFSLSTNVMYTRTAYAHAFAEPCFSTLAPRYIILPIDLFVGVFLTMSCIIDVVINAPWSRWIESHCFVQHHIQIGQLLSNGGH